MTLSYDERSEIRWAFEEAYVEPERRRACRVRHQVAAKLVPWGKGKPQRRPAIERHHRGLFDCRRRPDPRLSTEGQRSISPGGAPPAARPALGRAAGGALPAHGRRDLRRRSGGLSASGHSFAAHQPIHLGLLIAPVAPTGGWPAGQDSVPLIRDCRHRDRNTGLTRVQLTLGSSGMRLGSIHWPSVICLMSLCHRRSSLLKTASALAGAISHEPVDISPSSWPAPSRNSPRRIWPGARPDSESTRSARVGS